jgi:hypothetical protein
MFKAKSEVDVLAVDVFDGRLFGQSTLSTINVLDNLCFRTRFFRCWCSRARRFWGTPPFRSVFPVDFVMNFI